MTGFSNVEMYRATLKNVNLWGFFFIFQPQKPGYRAVISGLVADSSHSYLIQGSFFTRERMALSLTMSLGLKFSHCFFGAGREVEGCAISIAEICLLSPLG